MIAAQIAALQKNKEATNRLIYRALRQGVNLRCLQSIPIIDNYLSDSKQWEDINVSYDSLHKQYLKSIDFKKKLQYVSHYLDEQSAKIDNATYYPSILLANYAYIVNEIKNNGFPGDKMIGIDDRTYTPECEDCRLSAENTLITLYHYPCSFTDLQSELLKEIKSGNLHPRDYAYICEFERRLFQNNQNRFVRCKPQGNYPDYKIDWFKTYTDKEIVAADALRNEINICPFEQDLKKKEYEEKYGFKFFFGFGIGYFGGHR